MHLFVHPFQAMGTPCELRLYSARPSTARQAAAVAEADVRRLEARYSRYRPDSDLSALNRVAAAGGQATVDEETAALLDYADTCHRQSQGLFDVSSGLLRQAWRWAEGRLPDPAAVAALLPRVGWHHVQWQRPHIRFDVPGMELDFGGIVKEYAADRAAALLAQAGVAHALVNLGGDVRVLGPLPDGSPWSIGIRHPRAAGLLGTVQLHQGALASSGDYERCIVVDGVRHGHILNPRTGWPVRHLAAVSVVAPLCVLAGSAATLGLLLEDQGPAWLQASGLAHLWVDTEGRHGGPLMTPPAPPSPRSP